MTKYTFLINHNISDTIIPEHLCYELFLTNSLFRPIDSSSLKQKPPLFLPAIQRAFFLPVPSFISALSLSGLSS